MKDRKKQNKKRSIALKLADVDSVSDLWPTVHASLEADWDIIRFEETKREVAPSSRVQEGVVHLTFVAHIYAFQTRCVCNLARGKSQGSSTGIFELYGQGGLSRAARRYHGLNVRGLGVLDLRTLRPDGEHWDSTRAEDRAWVFKLLQQQRPKWAIASPHCTNVTLLNWNINFPRMPQTELQRRVQEGVRYTQLTVIGNVALCSTDGDGECIANCLGVSPLVRRHYT